MAYKIERRGAKYALLDAGIVYALYETAELAESEMTRLEREEKINSWLEAETEVIVRDAAAEFAADFAGMSYAEFRTIIRRLLRDLL